MRISLFFMFVIVSNLYEKVETQVLSYQVQLIKKKLFKMMVDVMFDAKAKIQSIRHIRNDYSAKKAFEFAFVIYDIRRKYTRMLQIHKAVLKELNRPYDYYNNPKTSLWYQDFMLEAVHTGGEIDKLIQAIEEHEYEDRPFDPKVVYHTITRPKAKKKKNLRFLSADKKLHQLFTLKGRRWEDNDLMDSITNTVTKPIPAFSRNSTTTPTTKRIFKKSLDGLQFDSELE